MMNGKRYFHFIAISLSLGVFAFLNLSCSQYDYSSPLPGTIEIRLKTVSNNIEFQPLNNFTIKVTSVEALRANATRVVIYEDVKAINRTANIYNTLDFRARDSTLVIGQGFAPPDNYIGVLMTVEPGKQVVLNGYRTIEVSKDETFDPLLVFAAPFTVRESQSTKITLTLNLDSTLVKGTVQYYFRPNYYISSIQ